MTNIMQNIADRINSWDKKDAGDLRATIYELKDVCKVEADKLDDYTTDAHELFIQWIDLTSLPTCDFPDDFDAQECWAMDENGYILCGSDFHVVRISEFE